MLTRILQRLTKWNEYLKIIRPKSISILGRWKIENETKKTNIKIDLANEDHCGTCGEYINRSSIIHKTNIMPNKQIKIIS